MTKKLHFGISLLLVIGLAVGIVTINPPTVKALYGTNTLVSSSSSGVRGNGDTTEGNTSSDGRYVVFSSAATNLVANDTNNVTDIFFKDTVTGSITRISVDGSGNQGNGHSSSPNISSNGKYVVFSSRANNLVANDNNGKDDVFLYTVATGIIELVSKDINGTQGNDGGGNPRVSRDGRFITFDSASTNWNANDTNNDTDVFLKDKKTGALSYLSQSDNGTIGNAASVYPTMSCDGRMIAFTSTANNLVPNDNNGVRDVFLVDIMNGKTIQNVTLAGNSFTSMYTEISCDGGYVAYTSASSNEVSGDTNYVNDVFVYDILNNVKSRASIRQDGTQSVQGSSVSSISANGRYVTFYSSGATFINNDNNAVDDLFVRDMTTNTIEVVSKNGSGDLGNKLTNKGNFSADNSKLVFISQASNLISGDTNSYYDVFTVDTGYANTCSY